MVTLRVNKHRSLTVAALFKRPDTFYQNRDRRGADLLQSEGSGVSDH